MQRGDWDQAITDLTKSIELSPKDRDAMTYNNRGIAYCNRGDFHSGIKDLSKTIEGYTHEFARSPKLRKGPG